MLEASADVAMSNVHDTDSNRAAYETSICRGACHVSEGHAIPNTSINSDYSTSVACMKTTFILKQLRQR